MALPVSRISGAISGATAGASIDVPPRIFSFQSAPCGLNPIPPLATTVIDSDAYERPHRQGGRDTIGLLIRSTISTTRFARGAVQGFPLVCRE